MITYHKYDPQNIYTETVERTEFQPVPKPSTTLPPPKTTGTQVAWWSGSDWKVLPERPKPAPPPPPSKEQQQTLRAIAYRDESDPLFFKYQRGEATQQEWLDKIDEIRNRYPYPEVSE
jgi:hypothetical protein